MSGKSSRRVILKIVIRGRTYTFDLSYFKCAYLMGVY